jgi:hypothetical protein
MVPMPTHLNDATIDAYLARSLDRPQLRTLDDHVARCAECSLTVEATALDARRWERRGVLGRLAHRRH